MAILAAGVYALIGTVIIGIGILVVPHFEAPVRGGLLKLLRINAAIFEILNGLVFYRSAWIVLHPEEAERLLTQPLIVGTMVLLLLTVLIALAVATRLGQLRMLEPEAYTELLERRISDLEQELETESPSRVGQQ